MSSQRKTHGRNHTPTFNLARSKSRCYKNLQKCPNCQKSKKQKKKYGQLPPKIAESQPWEHLFNMIGPYQIQRKGKKTLCLQAITMR